MSISASMRGPHMACHPFRQASFQNNSSVYIIFYLSILLLVCYPPIEFRLYYSCSDSFAAWILFPSNENLRLYLFYSKAHGLQTANRPIVISHTAYVDEMGEQEDKVACVPYFLWTWHNIKRQEKIWQYLYHHCLLWFAGIRGCVYVKMTYGYYFHGHSLVRGPGIFKIVLFCLLLGWAVCNGESIA